MSTARLLITAAAGGGALLLAIAALQKLGGRERLSAVVRAHGVLPAPLAQAVVPLVPSGELAAALAFVLAQVVSGTPRVVLLALFSAWTSAYAAYLLLVLRRGSGASCGCLGSREPVNPLHVARVGLIALSGALLMFSDAQAADPFQLLVVAVLSGFCALLYWLAPLAARAAAPTTPASSPRSARAKRRGASGTSR